MSVLHCLAEVCGRLLPFPQVPPLASLQTFTNNTSSLKERSDRTMVVLSRPCSLQNPDATGASPITVVRRLARGSLLDRKQEVGQSTAEVLTREVHVAHTLCYDLLTCLRCCMCVCKICLSISICACAPLRRPWKRIAKVGQQVPGR